jgi:hypothetical protein
MTLAEAIEEIDKGGIAARSRQEPRVSHRHV